MTFFNVFVSVLLSAHNERFSVSHMQDRVLRSPKNIEFYSIKVSINVWNSETVYFIILYSLGSVKIGFCPIN